MTVTVLDNKSWPTRRIFRVRDFYISSSTLHCVTLTYSIEAVGSKYLSSNEISPYNREKATGIALAGMSERVIAAEIKCTRSYVRVAKELQNQAQGQSLPRGGRP